MNSIFKLTYIVLFHSSFNQLYYLLPYTCICDKEMDGLRSINYLFSRGNLHNGLTINDNKDGYRR